MSEPEKEPLNLEILDPEEAGEELGGDQPRGEEELAFRLPLFLRCLFILLSLPLLICVLYSLVLFLFWLAVVIVSFGQYPEAKMHVQGRWQGIKLSFFSSVGLIILALYPPWGLSLLRSVCRKFSSEEGGLSAMMEGLLKDF